MWAAGAPIALQGASRVAAASPHPSANAWRRRFGPSAGTELDGMPAFSAIAV
jgi:hypothetical protein